MRTPTAEDNPHFHPDYLALWADTVVFALLPGKRFLPRPVYEFEQSAIDQQQCADDDGNVVTPNFVIVDRTRQAGRYVRYAIYVADPDASPLTDRECIAHLRKIGAAL